MDVGLYDAFFAHIVQPQVLGLNQRCPNRRDHMFISYRASANLIKGLLSHVVHGSFL